MGKYNIIKTTDPSDFREQIINFWKDYLPDTTAYRFNWLLKGNPAGRTIWILAFLDQTDSLVGTVSLMPKEIMQKGNVFHGAIMGDFMVHEKHRVFGPAINLLKAAANYVSNNEFDFIYTIPNLASTKLVERVGFKEEISLDAYFKPINLSYYVEKYIPALFSQICTPVVEVCLRAISKDTYMFSSGICEEKIQADSSFDKLWKTMTGRVDDIVADHSAAYIIWRYMNNPCVDFRLLTYREKRKDALSGYIVFNKVDGRITVYEICALSKKPVEQMLRYLTRTARKERCVAIYFDASLNNRWLSILRSHRFFNAKNTINLFWLGNGNISPENWDYLQGDRNI